MTDPDDFQAEILEDGATVRVRLVGTLDAATLPAFLAAVEPRATPGGTIELDCADLAFCDSSGLGGIVSVRNAVGPSGHLALVAVSDGLRQILRITGLEDLATT